MTLHSQEHALAMPTWPGKAPIASVQPPGIDTAVGVLYVVYQQSAAVRKPRQVERFLNEAVHSAQVTRRRTPQLPIALATNLNISTNKGRVFDRLLKLALTS